MTRNSLSRQVEAGSPWETRSWSLSDCRTHNKREEGFPFNPRTVRLFEKGSTLLDDVARTKPLPYLLASSVLASEGVETDQVMKSTQSQTTNNTVKGQNSAPKRQWNHELSSSKIGLSIFRFGSIGILLKMFTSQAFRRALHFWCRAGPMIAHYKFTQFWLQRINADLEKRDAVYERLHERYAKPSLDIILALKGLYCKIGQVLSTRPDFMPPQYIVRFATVQDSIPQWPVQRVKALVSKTLKEKYDLEYSQVFESIDDIALGAASIGQVHRATLTDEWAAKLDLYSEHHAVAVKVMHPGSERMFANDLKVFRWLVYIALPGWKPLLEELERRVMAEFDYEREAHDMAQIRDNIANSPYASNFRIPRPEMELCTRHLLVMEVLEGVKLVDAVEDSIADAFDGDREKASQFIQKQQEAMLLGQTRSEALMALQRNSVKSMLKMMSMQRKYQRFVKLLLGVYGHQIFINSLYQADPHPGNCLELKDGTMGLVDFGQVRQLSDEDRLAVARVVSALADGSSAADVAKWMRILGFQTKDNSDDTIMKAYATIFFDSDFQSRELGFATPQLWFAK